MIWVGHAHMQCLWNACTLQHLCTTIMHARSCPHSGTLVPRHLYNDGHCPHTPQGHLTWFNM